MKKSEFRLKFVPKGPNDNIGSDNGVEPNRRQAFIWTSDSLNFTDIHVYASFGLNELINKSPD